MGREELTNPRDRLPEMTLRVAGTGGTEPVRPSGRRRPVLLLLHASCGACREYAAGLDTKEIERAGGALRIVLPEGSERLEVAPGAAVLEEAARGGAPRPLAAAIGVTPPAVLVADEWGEIHFRHQAGESHAFPELPAISEWLEHLAMRCPECEGEAY